MDVDSKASAVSVQWKGLTLAGPQRAPVSGLPPGVHALVPEPGPGALDCQRHPAVAPHLGCLACLLPARAARRALDRLTQDSWTSGSHLEPPERSSRSSSPDAAC